MTELRNADARRIGAVEAVSAGALTVAVDPEAPHGTALGSGTPTRFPHVNGIVVVPSDEGLVVGTVHSVGIVPADYPKRTGLRDYGVVDLPFPSRRLGVTPLGVLRTVGYLDDGTAVHRVDRGVLTPPTVGAPVLVPTASELAAIVEGSSAGGRVAIGQSALARDIAVRIDPDRLFGRHVAVLGNTGSGKSCTVAGLIRWSLQAAQEVSKDGRPPNARFIVVDPNGEYADAFRDIPSTKVFKAEPDEEGDKQLRVPAWLWNAQEWAGFTNASAGVQRPLLHQALRILRSGGDPNAGPETRVATLAAGYDGLLRDIIAAGPVAYTRFPSNENVIVLLEQALDGFRSYEGLLEDGDVAESLSMVVSQLAAVAGGARNNRGYARDLSEPALTVVAEAIAALRRALPPIDITTGVSEDAPVEFDVGEVATHLEVLAAGAGGGATQFVSSVNLRIRTMLSQARTRTVVGSSEQEESLEAWLDDYLTATDDGPSIAVVDLSLLPSSLMHVVVSVISRLIFEALHRYRKANREELPTVLVLEEAHHFVSQRWDRERTEDVAAASCRSTIETIAREGRKFGLGLMLSSQRPSEVSPTILSQCNTFVLHRLVNDRDQDLVRRLVPDNLGRMLDDLPSLPTQHAIVLGWAIAAPTLVRMHDLHEHERPRSSDPQFWSVWTHEAARPANWAPIADRWRSGDL